MESNLRPMRNKMTFGEDESYKEIQRKSVGSKLWTSFLHLINIVQKQFEYSFFSCMRDQFRLLV